MQSECEAALKTLGESESGDDHFDRSDASSRAHIGGRYHVPAYLGADWMDPFCRDVTQGKESSSAEETAADTTSANTDAVASASETLVGFGNGRSDYRFAYIGLKDTWTVLHYDVFGTYSWSFNVCGDKLWFFPTVEGNEYLRRNLLKGFPTPPDIRVLAGVEYWTVVQHPGDLVFVPSYYYHQVHNISGAALPLPSALLEAVDGASTPSSTANSAVELTVAVNRNWCNAFCIETMVDLFESNVDELARLLSPADLAIVFGPDRAMWLQQMETMLLGGANWNFASMGSFLSYCRDHFGDNADAVEERSGTSTIATTLGRLQDRVRRLHEQLFVW